MDPPDDGAGCILRDHHGVGLGGLDVEQAAAGIRSRGRISELAGQPGDGFRVIRDRSSDIDLAGGPSHGFLPLSCVVPGGAKRLNRPILAHLGRDQQGPGGRGGVRLPMTDTG